MALKSKKTSTLEYVTATTAEHSENADIIAQLEQQHDDEFVLCAKDFWYVANNFIITYDEENECNRNFPDYPYLHESHNKVEANQKVIFLKSRRLLITWYGMARHWWRMKFAGTGAIPGKDIFKGALMSVGETEAEELINRIKFIESQMPQWIQDRNPLSKSNQLFLEFEKGGSTRAFPLKRSGPRSFGFTEVFFDEMAFMEAVRSVYTGMIPTLGKKGKMIAVSTPNGPSNLYAEIWNNRGNRYPDDAICRIRLECEENPEHRGEWYKKATDGMDKRMIAREYGLSFSTPAGEPVWDLFDKETHVLKENPELIESRPLLICFDFGYHFPAATVWQYSTKDQFIGYFEYEEFDIDFADFCVNFERFLHSVCEFDKFKRIFFVDPAGKQTYHSKSKSGAVNDVGEIKNVFGKDSQVRFGSVDVGTRDNEGPRLKEVRKLWKLRADGNPGLVMSPAMERFNEGCMSGYCYPEKGGEVPEKNEASHLQDTFQYCVTGFNRLNKTSQMSDKEKERKAVKRKYSKFRTGN